MQTNPLSTFFYTVLVLMFTIFQQPLVQAGVVNGNKWKVEQGDTLFSIARALFPRDKSTQGKARHDIVSLNPEAFQFGPSSMQGGSLLTLPNYVGKHAEKPKVSPAPAIGPDGKWAVKKGDTLYSIARALFPGNKAKQAQVRHDITALNLEVFQSGANNMRVGTLLDLPAYVSKQTAQPTSPPAPTGEPTPAAMPAPAAMPSPTPPSQPIIDPDSLPVVKLKPPPQANTEPSAPNTATDKNAPPAGETEQSPANPLY